MKCKLIKKAYEILDKVTPLKNDCGKLCNQACCDTTDEEAGMYLFPGEETIYADKPEWLRIEQSTFTYGNEKAVSIAICRGQCNRELRPLACRIFPLTPYVGSDGVVSIIIDPQAAAICPLAKLHKAQKFDRQFVLAVNDVFKLLVEDKEIYSYILSLSRLIDDQEDLFFQFTGIRRKMINVGQLMI